MATLEPAGDQTGRTPWPVQTTARAGQPRVGIVVANSNTRALVAGLVFSLYRLLGPAEFAELVIVDNASIDGSRELLDTLHRAGLIHLIANERQLYHGPALTQAISWLARRQRDVHRDDQLDYIWVLDSDVIVLRQRTIRDALAVLQQPNVAAVGNSVFDSWHNRRLLEPFALMLDPALIWRPPLPPFAEHGAPTAALQIAAETHGLRLLDFPFVQERYILHLGRGTLREIANRDDTDNRYYAWATTHQEYHYSGNPAGAQLYAAFVGLLTRETGDLEPARLVEACRNPTRLTLE